jgi:hypothetical protein
VRAVQCSKRRMRAMKTSFSFPAKVELECHELWRSIDTATCESARSMHRHISIDNDMLDKPTRRLCRNRTELWRTAFVKEIFGYHIPGSICEGLQPRQLARFTEFVGDKIRCCRYTCPCLRSRCLLMTRSLESRPLEVLEIRGSRLMKLSQSK